MPSKRAGRSAGGCVRTRSRGSFLCAASSRPPVVSRAPAPSRPTGCRGGPDPRATDSPQNFAFFSVSSARVLPARSPSPAVGGSGEGGVTEGSPRGGASHGSSSPAPESGGKGGGGWSREKVRAPWLRSGQWRGGEGGGGRWFSAAATAARACTVAAAAAAAAAAAGGGGGCSALFALRRAARFPGTPTLSIVTLLTFGADVTRLYLTTYGSRAATSRPLGRRTPGD